MKEPARVQRNADRVGECFPAFGARLREVLDTLEDQGFRPRIQDRENPNLIRVGD